MGEMIKPRLSLTPIEAMELLKELDKLDVMNSHVANVFDKLKVMCFKLEEGMHVSGYKVRPRIRPSLNDRLGFDDEPVKPKYVHAPIENPDKFNEDFMAQLAASLTVKEDGESNESHGTSN